MFGSSHDGANRFIGFMLSGVITFCILAGVLSAGQNPEVVSAITLFSPWLAAHLNIIKWSVAAVLLIAGVTFPYISMVRDDGRLETLGVLFRHSAFAIVPLLCFLVYEMLK